MNTNARWYRFATASGALMALTLFLVALGGPALAKKPPKPADPPMANPALVFGVENDVHVITADGLQSELVTGGGRVSRIHTAWMPDAARIGFVEVVQKRLTVLSRTFYLINPDGSDPVSFGTYPGQGPFDWIDGERILIDGSIGAATDATVWDLANPDEPYKLGVIAELELPVGSPALTVDLDKSEPGYQGWLCITGGGDLSIVRVRDVDGTLTLDSATHTTLVRENGQGLPRWSHDATRIAFYDKAGADVGNHLAVIDVTLGNTPVFGEPKTILTEGRFFYRPTWSPDGNWIAMVWETAWGDREIFRIRPDGTGLTQLTEGGKWQTEDGVHWSPTWANDID